MNDALELIYYTLNRFFDFMFGAYIFDGVSIGMVLLVCGLFLIMLNYLVAIPRMRVADHSYKSSGKVSGNVEKK